MESPWDVCLVLLIALICVKLTRKAAQGQRIKEARTFNVLSPGSARFADNKDLRKAGLFRGKGVPIGWSPNGRRPLHYPGKGHILTVAAARTGKGATLLVNALLSWRNSVVCIDPKAENAAITSHWRRRLGPVFVLNPFEMLPDALKGIKQARFNPMDILDPASLSFHADCDKLAAACVWDEGKEGTHWTTAARILVSGVIAALVRHGAAHEKTLTAVARIISGDICEFCRVTVEATNDPFIVTKLGRYGLAPGKEPSREMHDVISTAITQLGFIGNAAIAKSLSGSDFRFADLRRKSGTTVYICLPLNKLDICDKYFRLIVECFLSDLLNEGQKGKGKPVLAIIDEMGQLGAQMKSLENAQGMISGAAGLIIWGVLQSLVQLQGMFPKTWETFIQNAGVSQFFGARDVTTQEYISKLAGTHEVVVPSRSVSIDHHTGEPHVNDSGSVQTRPLLAPHQAAQLLDNEMIAFVDGVRCGPIRAKRKFYFKSAGLRGYRDNPYFHKAAGLLRWLRQ
jgi:type IV secretion system protein VirD4